VKREKGSGVVLIRFFPRKRLPTPFLCRHHFEGRDDELVKALAVLEERGYVREVPRERQGATGRRPKPDYAVSPAVWWNNHRNHQNAG
jgi:hypothetical protein